MTKEQKQNKDKQVVDLLESLEFAKDQDGCIYAKITPDSKFIEVNSKEFSNFLILAYRDKCHKIMPSQFLSNAKFYASAYGDGNGKAVRSGLRFGFERGFDYIDMADEEGNVLRIDDTMYTKIKDSPIIFKTNSEKLPIKISGPWGDAKKFLKYANCSSSAQQMLLLVDLCLSPLARINQPVTCFVGQEGSGKTSTASKFRSVFDPTTHLKEDFVKTKEGFYLTLNSSGIPLFDNVRKVDNWLSDLICQAVTGTSYGKRKHYVDTDMFKVSIQKKILVTSINVPSFEPDFLDRALIFEFDRLPMSKNVDRTILDADFGEDLPEIREGCLKALVEAKRLLPGIELAGLSRMGDYERFGAAVAEALGYNAKSYVKSFRALQMKFKNTRAKLSANSFISAVKILTESAGSIEGRTSDMLIQLNNIGDDQSKLSNDWPKSPISLGVKLSKYAADLEDLGIVAVKSETKNGSVWSLKLLQTVNTKVEQMPQSGNDNDKKFENDCE
ncbi:hypothetical protein [Fundidesulfovibrio soli]|uniref:hypothetical protein n=1 Tax=Fundidesulfovibrio soli TaxID=2922716 RepID=UPI001FAFEFEC|nr:hypothetical protein [Fundidesulfovibrio soli]